MLSKCKNYILNDIELSVENAFRTMAVLVCAELLTDCTGIMALGFFCAFVAFTAALKAENKNLKEAMIDLKAQQNETDERNSSMKQILLKNNEIINQQQEKIAELQKAKIMQQSISREDRINNGVDSVGFDFWRSDFKRSESRKRAQKLNEQDALDTEITGLSLL